MPFQVTIKSLGAAMKRPYDLPLEHVIKYSEFMCDPGAYFMDSPGNDIESVTGQVASGCNLIMFVTGNGSVTNFPFVPTVKIITTTDVYDRMSNEMDINAGRILENSSIDEESKLAYGLVQKVASGQATVGEEAGHSQVQIWRDWGNQSEKETYQEQQSLRLDERALPIRKHLIKGYLCHPLIKNSLVLEHGCENLHLGFMRKVLIEENIDPSVYGWASIQKDGGIESVILKIEDWFSGIQVENLHSNDTLNVSENMYSVAILGDSYVDAEIAHGFATLCQTMSEAGISVILPTFTSLLQSKTFLTELFADASIAPNIDAANIPKAPGVHIMETYSDHFVENMTVLGASGVQLFLTYADSVLPQGHPFIPMLRICASASDTSSRHTQVFDVNALSSLLWTEEVVDTIRDIQAGNFKRQAMLKEYVDFQIPRGPSAVSM